MASLLTRRIPGWTRRRFLAGGLALGAALPAYARGVEPGWLKVRQRNLPGAGPATGRPLRFAHFTDIHFKGQEDRLREAVETVNRLAPDFACFTGDLVEEAGHVEPALRLLSAIRCPLYGVAGNHDHWADVDFDRYREVFAATGGRWLMDEALDLPGSNVRLLGLDHRFSPLRPEPGRFNLVLMHYPGWARELPWRGDLLLAGHSHGGQVRIPGYGALIEPEGTDGYDLGWFETASGPLYVNPGLGTFFLDVRLFCRPEITVFAGGGR